jgi:UDP-MurNAc hydroxylase
MNQLTFVNHASFYIANDETMLLVDPWVEGTVFNNGWSLLDNSTSNADLVSQIVKRGLNLFIWYSHEHPDHFSVSFIKRLKQESNQKVTVLFQRTKDGRVAHFLTKNGIEVIECSPGITVALDKKIAITVFPHADGDSWCLIKSGKRSILNLNDCPLASSAQCSAIQAKYAPLTSRIDFLFTQFGYANWVGNPFEPGLRRRAAAEKRARIGLQMQTFKPGLTIPFASFVSFCSVENSYLNDYQNSAYTIRQWSTLNPETADLRFMKPGDVLDLNRASPANTVAMSRAAVAHWERLGNDARTMLPAEPSVTPAEVGTAFERYRKAIGAQLPLLPALLELCGLIKALRVHFPDIRRTVRFSYVHGFTELPNGSAFDISMSSPSAVFVFSNEYGFNTIHVNGRFRTANAANAGALTRFSRFFMPQNLVRQGYGIARPFATASHLAGNLIGRLRPGA